MSAGRAISVRLPEPLIAALDELARQTDRSRTYLTRKALESYLAEEADLQLGLDRLRDPHDRVISGQELRRRLGRDRRV